MLQTHPSILAFLIGSDFWPGQRAAGIYVEALHDLDWPNPIICSAAKRGYSEILGPSGLKMNGPYVRITMGSRVQSDLKMHAPIA